MTKSFILLSFPSLSFVPEGDVFHFSKECGCTRVRTKKSSYNWSYPLLIVGDFRHPTPRVKRLSLRLGERRKGNKQTIDTRSSDRRIPRVTSEFLCVSPRVRPTTTMSSGPSDYHSGGPRQRVETVNDRDTITLSVIPRVTVVKR